MKSALTGRNDVILLRGFFGLLAFAAIAAAQPTLPGAVPFPNPEIQFLDAAGKPLAGGKLCTYAAGTSTPLATYTDSTAATPNTNPVVLNTAGRASVWVGPQLYKFVLRTGGSAYPASDACTTGTIQWTQDYVADTTLYFTNYVKTVGTCTMITFTATGTGAVTRTCSAKLGDIVSVKDFGAVGDGTAADGPAIQAALDVLASTTGTVHIPRGIYSVAAPLTVPSGVNVECESAGTSVGTTLVFSGTSGLVPASPASGYKMNVKGCKITNIGATGSTIGIDMHSVWSSVVEMNRIEGFNTCIDLNGAVYGDYFNDVRDNEMYTCVTAGISLESAARNTISTNKINSARKGISLDTYSYGNLLQGNDIESLPSGTSYGIYDVGSTNVLSANWAESTSSVGDTFILIYEHGGGYTAAGNHYGSAGSGTNKTLDYGGGAYSISEPQLQLYWIDLQANVGNAFNVGGQIVSAAPGYGVGTLRGTVFQEEYTNGLAQTSANYRGYLNGVTQPRDFQVFDGRQLGLLWVKGDTFRVGVGLTTQAPLTTLHVKDRRAGSSADPTTVRIQMSQNQGSGDLLRVYSEDGTQAYSGIDSNGNASLKSTTLANLPTPGNNAVMYCSDCSTTTLGACAGSGTGALAVVVNSLWKCIGTPGYTGIKTAGSCIMSFTNGQLVSITGC